MHHSRRIFFSFDHRDATAAAHYHELKQWLEDVHTGLESWTTADLERELEFEEPATRRSRLVDHIVHSDYVIAIIGDSPIDSESMDFQALNTAAWMKRPLIATNANQHRDIDRRHFPELLADQLILHIPLEGQVITHALETWRDESFRLRTMGQNGPVHYKDDIYELIENGPEPLRTFQPTTNATPDTVSISETETPWSATAAA